MLDSSCWPMSTSRPGLMPSQLLTFFDLAYWAELSRFLHGQHYCSQVQVFHLWSPSFPWQYATASWERNYNSSPIRSKRGNGTELWNGTKLQRDQCKVTLCSPVITLSLLENIGSMVQGDDGSAARKIHNLSYCLNYRYLCIWDFLFRIHSGLQVSPLKIHVAPPKSSDGILNEIPFDSLAVNWGCKNSLVINTAFQ